MTLQEAIGFVLEMADFAAQFYPLDVPSEDFGSSERTQTVALAKVQQFHLLLASTYPFSDPERTGELER